MYSQTWTKPYNILVEFKSNELDITFSGVVEDLDSIIFQLECPNLLDKKYKYFSVGIKKDSFNLNSYNIILELLNVPTKGDDFIGHFKYNGYIFFMNGDNPYNFFKKNKKIEKFSFMRGKFSIPEDFPIWEIEYICGRMKLIWKDCWEASD